jgi:hypothetical protein
MGATMSDIAPFKCQFCGSQDGLIRANAKPKTYKDLVGSTCSNCGHIFSEDDVKKATREIATLLAKDAFRRSRR